MFEGENHCVPGEAVLPYDSAVSDDVVLTSTRFLLRPTATFSILVRAQK